MKKKILNFFMIGALTLAASAGMVSCTDYDDDIKAINEQLSKDEASFNEQLSALKAALDQAKSDAASAASAAEAAAKSYADAVAKGALDEAKIYADQVSKKEAEAAAANAKAEAIEEAKALIEKAIVDCQDYTDAQIASLREELGGQIAGIQNDLDLLNGDETKEGSVRYLIAKAKEDLQVQIDALMKYESLLNDLAATYPALKETVAQNTKDIEQLQTDLKQAIADIDDLKQRLTDAEGNISANASAITELKSFMTEAKAKLDNEIPAELNSIHTLVMVRLTSLQYIPNYFIGGIQTIYFENVDYTPLINNEDGVLAENPRTLRITKNIESVVSYRLNPSGVDENTLDLAAMKYVNSTATIVTRSGEREPVIYPVEDTWSIKDKSVLTFRVQQATNNLSNGAEDVVDIVCLQLPLKGDALAKGETEALVYSDYAQVRSTMDKCRFYVGSNVEGHVATVAKPVYMCHDKADAYAEIRQPNTEDMIYQITIPNDGKPFNLAEQLNLIKIIDENEAGKNAIWDKEMIERAGFELRFSKPTDEYKPEGATVDHQSFYNISEAGIVELVNADQAKDKGITPVVLCQVVDGAQVVTEAYFRIKIGEKVVELAKTEKLVLSEISRAMTVSISAEEMKEKVYDVLGITQADLEGADGKWAYTIESEGDRVKDNMIGFDKDGNYYLWINVDASHPDYSSSKIWANTVLDEVANNYNSSRTSTATITFTSNINEVVKIDLSIIPIKPYYTLGYVETPWKSVTSSGRNQDKGVLIANPSAFSNESGENGTTKYVFNVYDGFNLSSKNNPKCIVKDAEGNILCDKEENDAWLEKGYGFKWVKPEVNYMRQNKSAVGLQYYLPEVSAENIENNTLANAVDFSEIGAEGNWGVKSARTFINGCEEEGAELPHFGLYAELPIPVILENVANATATKFLPLGDYTVEFKKPLRLEIKPTNFSWTDAVNQAQTLTWGQMITVKDWEGKEVDMKREGSEYKDFYNVSYCDFDYTVVNDVKVAKVTTNLKEDGLNVVVDPDYREGKLPANTTVIVTQDGAIKYQNSGNLITKPYDIFVPVSIEHKWGKETKVITIHVNVHE
ncbi:MAG: PspA/IM30 family protein [Muribaculaceae bacterium]